MAKPVDNPIWVLPKPSNVSGARNAKVKWLCGFSAGGIVFGSRRIKDPFNDKRNVVKFDDRRRNTPYDDKRRTIRQ